jgi:glycosyltransferase involved in cell wall biosynthesis
VKLGVVSPRYGVEVHGGAEGAARMLAERLAQRPGWRAEVFTTCAVEPKAWANELSPGTVDVNGVTVHRFPSREKDVQGFHQRSIELFRSPPTVSRSDALDWVDQQGPVCPAAVEAADESDCTLITFQPYLYWPTVHGVPRMASRAVLHPATHDEPPIHFSLYRETFTEPRALVFWSDEERDLAQRLFPATVTRPQLVLGIGVEPGEGDAAAAVARVGLADRPYVLCLGNVTEMKGTAVLARFFARYKERHPGPLALVFAGLVADAPPPHPDIILTGPIDEATKWGLLRGATVLCSPSAFESLSLVVLEAWAVGTPVLVNGLCEPTRGHCRRSGGGLWYDGYATFDMALDRLVRDPTLRRALAGAGGAYVERFYRWDTVVDRYAHFLERVAARSTARI